MTTLEYIKKHQNDEDYLCECIILPDGSVEESHPSHIEKLIEISHREDRWLKQKMDKGMEPLFWMNEFTGCACVWQTRVVASSHITCEQQNSIDLLHDATLLAPKYLLEQADETYAESIMKIEH